MKDKLLELLCVPGSQNEDLILHVEARNGEEIITGTLEGVHSKNRFPIVNGIPRFVDKDISDFDDQVKERFELQWEIWGKNEVIFGRTKHESIDYFNEYSGKGFNQKQLKDKICLDAGCGHGRFTEIMAEGDALVSIGIDFGEGIEIAKLRTQHLQNVELIQADLQKLPFKSHIVDYVWSDGVLHHTENTRNTFEEVSRLVKNGGGFRVWFYPKESSFWEVSQRTIRSVTTLMPPWLLMMFCYMVVPLLSLVKTYSGTKWPKNNWKDCAQVIWDWYSPKYQWHHTPEEVKLWYQELEYSDLESHDLQTSVFGIKAISLER